MTPSSPADTADSQASRPSGESGAETYRLPRGQRIAGVIGWLTLVALSIKDILDHGWAEAAMGLGGLLFVMGVMTVQLAREIRVTDDGIHEKRLFWWDRKIAFADVERFYVPVTRVVGAQFFTEPHGSAVLSVHETSIDRYDDFLHRVAARLPDTATIEDPNNRLPHAPS